MNLNFLWFGKYVATIADDRIDTRKRNRAGREGLDYISDVCSCCALDDLENLDEYEGTKRYAEQCRTEDEFNDLVTRCHKLSFITDHWLNENAPEGLEIARSYMESVSDMAKWQLDQLLFVRQFYKGIPESARPLATKETRSSLFIASRNFKGIDRADLYRDLMKAGLFPSETEDDAIKQKSSILGAFLFGDNNPATIGQKLTIAPGANTKLAFFIGGLSDMLSNLRTDTKSADGKAEQWFVQSTGDNVKRGSLKAARCRTAEPGIDDVISRYFLDIEKLNRYLKA